LLAVLAEVVPLAVGIAASPMPILPVILLLAAPGGRRSAGAFVAAWAVGVTIPLVLPMLLVEAVESEAGTPTWAKVVKLVLGLLLIVLALNKWRGRSRAGDEPPGWTTSVATLNPPRAARLALLLTAANPKVWLLAGAAGVGIGAAALGTSQSVVAALVFVVVASSTAATPFAVALVLGERAEQPMRAAKSWLERNNDVILAAVMAVIGVVLAVQAVAEL